MDLNQEQVRAAELAGCQFRAASPDEVQRFAMQRRVFFIEGQAHLAVRQDGFCETVGTLEPLVAYGMALLASMVPTEPAAAVSSEMAAEPSAVPEPVELVAPKRRGRPPKVRDASIPEAAPKRRGRPPKIRDLVEPVLTLVVPSPPSEPLSAAVTVPIVANRRAGQTGADRWLTAGAERRGRAGVHWSTRRG